MIKALTQWTALIAGYYLAFQINVYAASVILLSQVVYEVNDYLEFRKQVMQLREARQRLLTFSEEDKEVGNC